jgi:uncharacterized membrane protein (UPF0127 family)
MKLRHTRIISLVSGFMALCFVPLIPSFAQSSLIFERAQIHIESPAPNDKIKNQKPPHVSLVYDVEVRPEDALKLEYIHALNTLTDESGVMITLDAPSSIVLPAMKVYTAVDMLFLDEMGTVLQIMPKLVLSELTQPLRTRMPVKAILFLKEGDTAARGIHPQDIVME